MRIVVAACTVDYAGRLAASLPEAKRLLVVKADGSVLVHADSGGYKPLNWMSGPCVLVDGGDVWEVTNVKGERLTITFTGEVVLDSAVEPGGGGRRIVLAMHGDEMTTATPGPPPATGAWRPGDPAGHRQFVTLFDEPGRPLRLELGGTLSPVVVAYETWGELDRSRSNAVLVAHALTGDSHAAGPAGPGHRYPGWWDHSIGPGKDIDTNRWFVVCPNVLGGCQGTTGPSSIAPDGRPYGSRFPRITIRDQVAVEVALAGALGLDERWAAVIGGSMGGMRALEGAVGHPD